MMFFRIPITVTVLLLVVVASAAFQTPSPSSLLPTSTSTTKTTIAWRNSRDTAASISSAAYGSVHLSSSWLVLHATGDDKKKQGVSSSGYRQDRLNKLAELEDSRIETDKGFVLKAAGGFVAFLVLLLAAAFASGILDQV
jgi:hypothetical protein